MHTYVSHERFEINGRGHGYQIESRVSMEDSKRRAYSMAWDDGWRPGPLRETWWQFWRPCEHSDFIKELIATKERSDAS